MEQTPTSQSTSDINNAEKKTCIWSILSIIFAFIFPMFGIIFGIVALVQISKNKSLRGKGLAIAGIIISAVLFILTILFFMFFAIAYFGVLSPPKLLPERTTFSGAIPAVDMSTVKAGAANEGTVTIALKNNVGFPISIDDITAATGSCGGVGTGAKEVSIGGNSYNTIAGQTIDNNEYFIIRFTCSNKLTAGEQFNSDITFAYTNTDSDLAHFQSGSIKAKIV